MFIINSIRGFCMALADSVPGVSGGTIAFVLAFYDKFVLSLKNIFSGSKDERIEALKFLLNLGVGWVIGIILSVLFITSIFESHIYEISSLFIGFIVASIPIVIKEEKKSVCGHYQHSFLLLLGTFLVWAMSYYNDTTASTNGLYVSLDHLNLSLGLFIFFAGMIAISAMVLPGISGSTILLIFGLYAPILGAVKEVIKFNFAYFPTVMIFGTGIIIGIAITIRAVKYALENYRPQMIYFIIGLMIGSLYAVVKGPESLTPAKTAMTMETFHILYFVLGGLLIYCLEGLKNIMLLKQKNTPIQSSE